MAKKTNETKSQAVEGKDFSLDAPAPKLLQFSQAVQRVAYISDVHVPFQDDRALNIVWQILADFEPQLVYLGGDVHDNYALSNHDKDPDRSVTLQDELDFMRKVVVEPLNEITPRVIYQLGNHEERTYRLIRRERALAKLRSLSFKRAAELPASWTVLQDQTHLRIGKLLYHHGDVRPKAGGKHLASGMMDKLRTSNIHGHAHRFDVHYATDYEGHVAATYSNGHLSDVAQARYITAPNWQQGVSLIEYSSNMQSYAVQQVLIHDRAVVWRGAEYM